MTLGCLRGVPPWLVYLSVTWKFWGHMQVFGILQVGVSLQLDPQWHFKIASGPENPAFLFPAPPNEWSVEADLFSGGCTHDHDVDGLGGHRIVQCMVRIMVYLMGVRLPGFKSCLYLLVTV